MPNKERDKKIALISEQLIKCEDFIKNGLDEYSGFTHGQLN